MGPQPLIRLGTRGSNLALRQTALVEGALRGAGCSTERCIVRTTGDAIQDVPLERIGSTAIFTRELDEALIEGRIDAAIHSLKDLPTRLPDGIVIGAVGRRENPADVFVGNDIRWSEVPEGGVVATSSVRRRAELLRNRPDLTIVPIRGNVETRLQRLDATPAWSGTVLAAAGLVRLDLAERIADYFSPDFMLPAPGQGALAVTVRSDDHETAAAVASCHHEGSALAVTAERALLRRLDGGCQVPVGALANAQASGDGWRVDLRGRVVSLDGRLVADASNSVAVDSADDATQLGSEVAGQLCHLGADDILRQVRQPTELD